MERYAPGAILLLLVDQLRYFKATASEAPTRLLDILHTIATAQTAQEFIQVCPAVTRMNNKGKD
jgi:hypothetical protein